MKKYGDDNLKVIVIKQAHISLLSMLISVKF